MSVLVVVNDPVQGQTVVPQNRQDAVLALMPADGKQEWRCGNGCYGFIADDDCLYTIWVISTECGDINRIPRELVREAMYR